ncbi:MAG: endopeptidase La [Acidobacteriota bacterium]
MSSRNAKRRNLRIPEVLPVLPLRDVVVFPNIITPLSVSRPRSTEAVDSALADNRLLLLVSQLSPETEEPGEGELYAIGTAGLIIKTLKLPDDRVRVLVQGLTRCRVEAFNEDGPMLTARVSPLPDEETGRVDVESEALLRNVRKMLEDASSLGQGISSEVLVIAQNLEDPGRLADLAASNLELKVSDAQVVLETMEPHDRLRKVNEVITREVEVLHLQQEISSIARGEMDRSQREYFLRQQLRAIHGELGEGDLADECAEYREKAEAAGMPEGARSETERQVRRLERMAPDSPEAATLRTYLDTMVDLPWSEATEDRLELSEVADILDEDHHGLDKAKERILEYLAVRKLKDDATGPILCLVGPPGVGKTSIARSIARAMGRQFVRLSLGGVRDEAEIRGHRRTYVGAMPGRIIQGLQQAGSNNPVFLLDEVDKIGSDHRGDPSAALLEVLDPEQNSSFRDHYLGAEFDLSKVLFIATANVMGPIHPAFRDRLEILRLTGYTEEEKLAIARLHLLPRQGTDNGISEHPFKISDNALRRIVSSYTHESGLRSLERQLGKICRKVARRHAEGNTEPLRITASNLQAWLGSPPTLPDRVLSEDRVGVATGLAVTSVGGDVLFVEALTVPGDGRVTLTGSLGAVMKESAEAALSFVRSRAADLGLDPEQFRTQDLHVHVPEGATPKDGPSAGTCLISAIVSAFTGVPIHRHVAMTGEVTLRGAVLPVGGVRDKVLAARRAGVSRVILAEANRKDLSELPAGVRRDLDFEFVSNIEQVLQAALVSPPAPRPRRGSSDRDHRPATAGA